MDDDGYEKEVQDRIREGQWVEDIIEDGACCTVCGCQEDPRLLEHHHIAGKHNSPITIPVCPTCHRKLTWKQGSWPRDWTSPYNAPRVKRAFLLRGLGDLNHAISDVMLEGDGD